MKKLSLLLLSAILSFSMLTACSNTGAEETTTQTTETTTQAPEMTPAPAVDVKVAVLKGATAMGIAQFMDANEKGEITDNNYTFDIFTDPAEVTALLAKGEVDIAAIPANLASVLYNNTDGAIQVVGINTLGVLYIVENGESVTSIEDLKGKTIYATGKGATPEYSLRYILEQNGINPDTDVTIEWKSEAAEVLASISATDNAIAMLPEPFVSTAKLQNENLRVALDLTQEWDATQLDSETPSTLVTGVYVVRKEFAQENPSAVEQFTFVNAKNSVDFMNSNLDEAAILVAKYEIASEAAAKNAIPNCNLVVISGDTMQSNLSGYLEALYNQNPASIGGTLPGEDFYLNYAK